jgi:hypothetical protein
MGSLERRLKRLESGTKREQTQLGREALTYLSDEELKAAEEALLEEARARGEEPSPTNELLEEMKRWEAEAIERQRAYAEAHRTPSG